jgi:hypothetical protein
VILIGYKIKIRGEGRMTGKQIKMNTTIALLIVSVLLTTGISQYIFGNHNEETSSVVIENSMVDTASYIVWTNSTHYFAKNGKTGEIEFSGTDAYTVIQSAINNLPDNGVFVVKGEGGSFPLSHPLTLTGYYKVFYFYATFLNPPGAQAIVCGDSSRPLSRCEIHVNVIDGTDRQTGKYGIHLKNGRNNIFYVNHILNTDIAIYIDGAELNKPVADNEWYFNLLDFNRDGIVIQGGSYVNHAEGNRFYGGSIFNNTNRGLWIKAYAKHTFFNAVADYNHPDIDDDCGYTYINCPFVRTIDRTDLNWNQKDNSIIITAGGILEGGFIASCSGSATFSGDGSRTYFDIEHHLSEPAHTWGVTKASNILQNIVYVEEVVIGNVRYLRVHFDSAPHAGTNNVVLKWWAKIHIGMAS